MLRRGLSMFAVLGPLGCAQLAGFEELTSRELSNGGSSGNASTSGGAGSQAGGAAPGGGNGTPSGASAGESAHEGGSAAVGGNATSGGSNGAGSSAGGTVNAAGAGGSGGSAGAPPLTGCGVNLLQNGDFDEATASWLFEVRNLPTITSVSDLILESRSPPLLEANVAPKSGQYLAWLGGILHEDKASLMRLMQDVQIPDKVTKLVVSGFLQVKTTEPSTTESFDHFELVLVDDVDQWIFATWWPRSSEATPPALGQWFEFSEELEADWLDAVRGRRLTFLADAQADTGYETSYFLDSLSLTATCSR